MADKHPATGASHAHSHAHGADCCGHTASAKPDAAPSLAKDPVCGMSVDPHTAKHRAEHAGRTYYFCAAGCRTKFMADPEKYLAKEERVHDPVPEGTIYTCPMHPQIRQVGPGSCPICGMALEPELVTAEHGPHPELVDMQRRFWIGLALALPVVALEMGGHLTGLHLLLGQTTSNWLQLVLATPVVLWAGWPFFERGWQSLLTRNLNMFTLIAMGTGVAWVYSVIATVAPGIFPPAFRGAGRRGGRLFRGSRRHHRAGAARPGARTARARADLRRHPRLARSRAQDGAAREGRWLGRGHIARHRRRRRPSARPAGREGAGRRRADRGSLLAR